MKNQVTRKSFGCKAIKLTQIAMLTFLFGSCIGVRPEISAKDSYENILNNSFGDAMEFIRGKKTEIHFCPDNTCFLFSSQQTNDDRLVKFTVVYLRFISKSNYFQIDMKGKGTFENNSRKAIEEIVREHGVDCIKGKLINVYCLLERIDERNRIVVEFSRADEGENRKANVYPDERSSGPILWGEWNPQDKTDK